MAEAENIINVPEQFERTDDRGYLSAHIKLTKQIRDIAEQPIDGVTAGFVGASMKSDNRALLEQACEDVARKILLSDEDIRSVTAEQARQWVIQRYELFLENPKLAESSRGAAIH